MRGKLLALTVPVYLLACLLLGGSAQATWGNLTLQLAGLLILVWASATTIPMAGSTPARPLLWLAVAAVVLIALQLIPLPPAVWTSLPGRGIIASDLALAGVALPWMPISLDPYATWAAALQLIPPLAIVAGIVRLGAYRESWLVVALAAATIAGVMLGAAQVGSTDPFRSPFYLYPQVNWGAATGFFANTNHMGSLLLCTIPFLCAVVARARQGRRSGRQKQSVMVLAAGGLLVVLVGIALNGSLAVWMLTVPVALGSLLIMLRGRTPRRVAGSLIVLAVLAAPVAIGLSSRLPGTGNAVSVSSRADMARLTTRALADHFPVGSGIGSFVRLYPRYEDPTMVDSTYVVHAHNDYLELALETGVPGLILLIAFLAWFVRRALSVWRSDSREPMPRAASIAVAALLAHSLVDYPLRTSALAALFAIGVAFLAEPRSRRRGQGEGSGDEPAARHLTL
jgi:O-antigen ligase